MKGVMSVCRFSYKITKSKYRADQIFYSPIGYLNAGKSQFVHAFFVFSDDFCGSLSSSGGQGVSKKVCDTLLALQAFETAMERIVEQSLY